MLYLAKNLWVRRRARALKKTCPYLTIRECVRSAAEDYAIIHG